MGLGDAEDVYLLGKFFSLYIKYFLEAGLVTFFTKC